MFQGVKVPLARCIVIGTACSAHALLDEQGFARTNKLLRSKLAALIAVKDETLSRFMSLDSNEQGTQSQLGGDMRAIHRCDNRAVIQIDDRAIVAHPATFKIKIGEVNTPNSIWSFSMKLLVK